MESDQTYEPGFQDDLWPPILQVITCCAPRTRNHTVISAPESHLPAGSRTGCIYIDTVTHKVDKLAQITADASQEPKMLRTEDHPHQKSGYTDSHTVAELRTPCACTMYGSLGWVILSLSVISHKCQLLVNKRKKKKMRRQLLLCMVGEKDFIVDEKGENNPSPRVVPSGWRGLSGAGQVFMAMGSF